MVIRRNRSRKFDEFRILNVTFDRESEFSNAYLVPVMRKPVFITKKSLIRYKDDLYQFPYRVKNIH